MASVSMTSASEMVSWLSASSISFPASSPSAGPIEEDMSASSSSSVSESASSTDSNIANGSLTFSAKDDSGANSTPGLPSTSAATLKVPSPAILTKPSAASPWVMTIVNSFRKAPATSSPQFTFEARRVMISGIGIVNVLICGGPPRSRSLAGHRG